MRVVLSIICKAKCTFVSASNQYYIVAVIQFCQRKDGKLFSLIVVLLVHFAFSGCGVRIYMHSCMFEGIHATFQCCPFLHSVNFFNTFASVMSVLSRAGVELSRFILCLLYCVLMIFPS